MKGQMAIAIALPGFNDLGWSVTPTFLSRNRFSLQLSPHRPKIGQQCMHVATAFLFALVCEYGAA